MFKKGKFDTFRAGLGEAVTGLMFTRRGRSRRRRHDRHVPRARGDLRMNGRCKRPDNQSLQAQGLSLPGYGLDLEVRPYPLAVRGDELAIHAICAEGVSSFLGRMTATKLVDSRLH